MIELVTTTPEQRLLHAHVLDEFICATDILELTEADLSNDSTKLATGGGDTVGS